MTFTSFNFLIFFPAFSVVYYLTPLKYRWLALLVGSYFFYISIKPIYALLTAGITISTFIFTKLIDNTDIESNKKKYMIINIIIILLPLLFFKYFSIINNNLLTFLESNNLRWPLPEMNFILPIGISFYTFMAIGYTIDVYNEQIRAEKNIGILALFISYFPLVLSGPIERAGNMLPQFRKCNKINYEMVSEGLRLMLWGYFMKLVVADRLSIYIDAVFDFIPQHNGTSLLFASCLRPFQLYADLGGYSLIAIGTSRMLGFNVIPNFNRPFFSTSMAEFWRRWHMSLISWLTDYIYTPLSFTFRRLGIWGIVFALLLTFLISGIWHGAHMTFIIWGLFQGVLLSIEALTYKKRVSFERRFKLTNNPWYIIFSIIITFALFTVSLVFSRAGNLDNALLVFHKIFTVSGPLYIDKTTIVYSLFGLSVLIFKDLKDEYLPGRLRFFDNRRITIRYASYLAILFIILLIGVTNGGQFIYFKF